MAGFAAAHPTIAERWGGVAVPLVTAHIEATHSQRAQWERAARDYVRGGRMHYTNLSTCPWCHADITGTTERAPHWCGR